MWEVCSQGDSKRLAREWLAGRQEWDCQEPPGGKLGLSTDETSAHTCPPCDGLNAVSFLGKNKFF